jgi:predicted transcriptional regulator
MSKETVLSTLSTRISEEIKVKLDELARATDRSVEWHVERALGDYVDLSRWHIEEIKKGLGEVKAGQWVSHDEVKAWVDSWGNSDELPMPEPNSTSKWK